MIAVLLGAFVLSSPAFGSGEPMPTRYTCDGRDVSPPLRWTAPPRGTRSLSLTVVDPDAPGGTFVHWRVGDIPASARSLPERAAVGRQGTNSFGKTGWGGPCPPRGKAHRYVFVLTAVGPAGRVLARARLVATYARF